MAAAHERVVFHRPSGEDLDKVMRPAVGGQSLAVSTLLAAVAIGLVAFAYALVVAIPLPPEMDLSHGSPGVRLLLLGAPVVLIGTFSLRGRLSGLASLGVILLLLGLVLSSLWSSAVSDGSLVGGLLPWSDASGYYTDASRLLSGDLFGAFSARRPVFSAGLASMLFLTGRDLQIALAVLAAVVAVALYLCAREVVASHGALAGAATAFILLAFSLRFVGTTLTDGLGLALGALAVAVLWGGGRRADGWATFFGVFLATTALMVRAGAFFILPALVLWRALLLGKTGRSRIARAAEGVIAVGLGILLNVLILKATSSPGVVPFSNFSHTLYGIAAGGKGWNQVYRDYPEVASLAEPAQSRRVFELAVALVRSEPLDLLRGASRSWSDYFATPLGAFSFIGGPVVRSVPVIRSATTAAALFGLLACSIRRSEAPHSLLLLAIVGVLFSVPFVPPIDADIMRAYAATIPFTAALAGVGAAYGWSWISRSGRPEGREDPYPSKGTYVAGLGLVVFLSVGPFAVTFSATPFTGSPP
jgi:hypothetical protein